MNIGELVLNLGIKGADKTVGALSNVKKGLGETASMSLEAKAGILGAMYALERLFASSGKVGTSLTNFNSLTGESVQMLQQYQYAARQVGVSNEEVEGSFKGLQSTMTKTLMGQGAPSGLAQVAKLTGNISPQDIKKFAEQPQLLIQKLQEYAKKETNLGLRNETLKSFGLGENMISALSRNAFRPEVLSKAPTYSDGEVKQLDKANIAWSNLGNKIQMAVGHFNAMHGGQLVTDISKIVDQVIKLVGAFTKLTDKLKLFEAIGQAFEGWVDILGGVTTAVDKISGAFTQPKKREQLLGDTLEGAKNIAGFVGYLGKSLAENVLPRQAFAGPSVSGVQAALKSTPQSPINKQAISPLVSSPASNTSTQNNNVNINNTFQHPGTDSQKTSKDMHKQVRDAVRQLSVQTQGT